MLFGHKLLSECGTNGGKSTNICAIRRQLEDTFISDSNFIPVKVLQIVSSLIKSSWCVEGVILVVIKVVLKSLDVPFHVWFFSVKFFCSLVGGVGGFEPVFSDDSAAVG